MFLCFSPLLLCITTKGDTVSPGITAPESQSRHCVSEDFIYKIDIKSHHSMGTGRASVSHKAIVNKQTASLCEWQVPTGISIYSHNPHPPEGQLVKSQLRNHTVTQETRQRDALFLIYSFNQFVLVQRWSFSLHVVFTRVSSTHCSASKQGTTFSCG